MSYRGARYPSLGDVSPSAAGEINGVALLGADVTALARRATEIMGGVRFDRSAYEAMQIAISARPGESASDQLERVQQRFARMNPNEIRQFVAGTVGQVASAVVRARQLAAVPVDSVAARDANHQLQASVIEPARAMWQAASEVLRGMQTVQQHQGQAGLGLWPIPVIIAIVVAGAVLGASAIAALTYWADAGRRLEYASVEADRICRDAGGCSPEQATAIRRQLQLGPWDTAAEAFGQAAGRGLTIGLAVGGTVAAVGLIGYIAYKRMDKREVMRFAEAWSKT